MHTTYAHTLVTCDNCGALPETRRQITDLVKDGDLP